MGLNVMEEDVWHFYFHNGVSLYYTVTVILFYFHMQWVWRRVTRNGFGHFFWSYCICIWNRSGKRLVRPQLRIRASVSLSCSPLKFICIWLTWRSRYGDKSTDLGRETFPQIVQTFSGILPASYSVGAGILSRG